MKTKRKNQAAMIRQLLAKKVSAQKIVERVQRACGGKPTVGYVNSLS
jgi:hypothetical protein